MVCIRIWQPPSSEETLFNIQFNIPGNFIFIFILLPQSLNELEKVLLLLQQCQYPDKLKLTPHVKYIFV